MLKHIHNLPHVIRLLFVRTAQIQTRKVSSLGLVLRTPKRIISFFEHKAIYRFLGSNLALAVVAGVLIPKANNLPMAEVDQTVIQQRVAFATERSIQNPVKVVKITQGYRIFHPGVDLDGITGDAIYPIMAGTVTNLQYSRFAYGNAVIVDHGKGVTSLYAHLSKIMVKVGQEVTTSTELGKMGSTGRSSGDHLHLEVRVDNRAINPSTVVPLR